MREVELYRIVLNERTPEQTIYLREVSGEKKLIPIVIGIFEANAIQMGLYSIPTERPMTHDLIFSVLSKLNCEAQRVIITRLVKGTFYSDLVVSTPTGIVRIDARPSDAIALAVRKKLPLFVSDEVYNAAAVDDQHNEQFDK
ncbi:MAG: bifunctional nuclease family protein [Planctomycetota bacterium]